MQAPHAYPVVLNRWVHAPDDPDSRGCWYHKKTTLPLPPVVGASVAATPEAYALRIERVIMRCDGLVLVFLESDKELQHHAGIDLESHLSGWTLGKYGFTPDFPA